MLRDRATIQTQHDARQNVKASGSRSNTSRRLPQRRARISDGGVHLHVSRQIRAMSSQIFEVGLFKPEAEASKECVMIPRTWDAEHVLSSIAWMRLQNFNGRNIYIRPAGEHNLTLIDDLKASSLRDMRVAGFQPALVVETSPNNFQAWLKHPRTLSKEVSTAAARELATQFDGDTSRALLSISSASRRMSGASY